MAKAKPKKKAQSTVEQEMALNYGFALSYLKSLPEVYALFKQAIEPKNNWTPEKFGAMVKNTKWYKTHGENFRTNDALRKTDPATYNANFAQTIASVQDAARKVGAVLTTAQIRSVAEHSMNFGWNDAQLSNTLANYIKFSNATGQAQSNIQQMQATAWKNGVRLNGNTYREWAQSIARGNFTIEDYNKYVRNQAKTLAPGYADQLDAGMDLHDIASPYMQSMASTLELNPSEIDLFDPTIRKAMSGVDSKGKPATTSLWQFEQGLRQDPRWLKTQNAQDAASSTAHKILSDFGMVS